MNNLHFPDLIYIGKSKLSIMTLKITKQSKIIIVIIIILIVITYFSPKWEKELFYGCPPDDTYDSGLPTFGNGVPGAWLANGNLAQQTVVQEDKNIVAAQKRMNCTLYNQCSGLDDNEYAGIGSNPPVETFCCGADADTNLVQNGEVWQMR